MTPAEYLHGAIRSVLPPDIPVEAIRFQSEADAAGPSVLWRQSARGDLGLLDAAPGNSTFSIECRSPTYAGAQFIAAAVRDRLMADGSLVRILSESDAPADPSSLRAGYIAAELTVEIWGNPAR